MDELKPLQRTDFTAMDGDFGPTLIRHTHPGGKWTDVENVQIREKLLLDALRPFAKRAEYFDKVARLNGNWDESAYADDPPSDVYVKQLRMARDVLAQFDAEENQ